MKFKAAKKIIALSAATAMTVGMLAGCGGKSDSNSGSGNDSAAVNEDGSLNTDQEVELVMYVVGDRPAGQDVVDEKLNEILKKELNCTLKMNWIGWAEYANKYPLLFSSGEEFDIAYAATWLNFSSLAQKGAFMNLDELWPTYAPDNYAAATEAAKEQATVAGHMYCVPTQLSTYTAYGPIYRGDLVEGSDWDGVMETFEDVEEYCEIVKETHPEIDPIDQYSAAPEWSYVYMQNQGYTTVDKGLRYMWFDPSEENPEVFTFGDYDGISDFLEMMDRWNKKGFYSKTALSDTDSQKTQNGKAALRLHNVDSYCSESIRHPDWDFHYANMVKDVAHLPYTQDCMVISNTSKNPERALAFWNLLTTNQELYDVLMYGVEDTTYTLNDQDEFQITDTDLYAVGPMAAARTNELNRNQMGTPEDFESMKEEWEGSITEGQGTEKYVGFVFDKSSIETEIAACANVDQQYWWPLELAYTDASVGLDEYIEKMKAAGIDKIVEEAQRQLDEYVANR